jgi:Carboxypeptidase regulatory-like domain
MDKTKTAKARTRLGVAVFLVMFLGCQIAGAQLSANASAQPSSEDRFGTIFGRVIGPDGGGVAGIRVHVVKESRGGGYSVRSTAETDCSGYYVRSGIEPGSYTVQFAGIGFLLESRNAVSLEPGKATKLDAQMEAGELKGERIDIEVCSGCILVHTLITGTVRDLTGAPIPGAKIMAIDEMGGSPLKTTADQAGFYALIDPRLRRFGIWATAPGFKADTARGILGGTEGLHAIVDVTLSVASGGYLEVTPHPALAGKGHNYQIEPAGGIHGKVMDANGLVPARITATELTMKKRYQTTTNYQGEYRLVGLPAGNYCTKFEAEGPRYGALVPEYETSRQIHVEREGLAEFDMVLPAIPEQIVVCSASCPIHTGGEPPTAHSTFAPPAFEPQIYAARNVIEPGQELWIDIDLENISGHDQSIRSENGLIASADYQIYVTGECGCPGPLLTHMSVDLRKSAPKRLERDAH